MSRLVFPLHQYTGGELGLSDPGLVMLDEPTLDLAPIITEAIYDSIEELQDRGMTIFPAEHKASFAMRHADRLYPRETSEINLSGESDTFRENEYIQDAYIGVT